MQKTYTIAREGFLMNTYRRVGETVVLHERQARYLILSGQLEDPAAAPAEPAQPAPTTEDANGSNAGNSRKN